MDVFKSQPISDQAQTLRLRAAKAAALTRGRARLMDSRDLTGSRLRIWDVGAAHGRSAFTAAAKDAVSQALLEHFPEVLWVQEPAAGVVWCVHAGLDRLPVQAKGWESTPVEVWIWGESGWKAQSRLQALFARFNAPHYLGSIADPESLGVKRLSFLLNLLGRKRANQKSQFEREISLFVGLWQQARQPVVSRFQEEPTASLAPRIEGENV